MTGAAKYPTTKPGFRSLRQRLACVGAGMVGLALVTPITATVIASSGPVAADQVSDLKAQAAQIARNLVLEQLQIGTDQQQYDVDNSKVHRDEVAIQSSEQRIRADVNRVRRDRKRLQSEAVSAYIQSGSDTFATPALFEGNQNEALARTVYEVVANGDINLTIDTLHTDENGLRTQRTTLEQQVAQDQATTNQEAAQADAARQTEAQLASTQSRITGELGVAVAQQQAAQAASAAAAVRAAQAKAPATVTTTSSSQPASVTTTTAPSATTATTAVQGSATPPSNAPPLPPFLQCVLQAESGGNYNAISPGGTYMGGFQFSQATWNDAAQLAGMPQLVNVPPNVATPAQQDDLAIALYEADGQQSWNDSCRTS